MPWSALHGVSEEDLDRLLASARERRFERREVVFHRGDPADALHLVEEGRFSVQTTTARGATTVLNVLGPGDTFGELAFLSDAPVRTATVMALEPARTRAIHVRDLSRLRAAHPQVTELMLAMLAERVRQLSDRLTEALYLPAEERVRRRLVEVASAYGPPSGEVTIPLTQEDLAELAGTSRATVNRVLREEQRRGTVRLARGRTVVVDGRRLAAPLDGSARLGG